MRHGAEGDHVVDHRRLAEQPLQGRQRRLVAHHAALAFQAFQQRRLFAADVGARAAPHLQKEPLAAARDALAQIARARGEHDCLAEYLLGQRILGAYVDVALFCADRQARDGHPFDEREGVAFHLHAIREGARVAFVGVADDVLGRGRRLQHGLPLDAGRKGGAAATPQARLGHLLHDLRARHFQGGAQPGEATVRDVVLDAERIGHAHARESTGAPGAARYGMASMRPWCSRCGPPARKAASNSESTSSSVTGP